MADAFNNYYFVGTQYVFELNNNVCKKPNSLKELKSQWIQGGNAIAKLLNSLVPVSDKESLKIIKLFEDLTISQINCLNNAVHRCANPSIPVNAAKSNGFYADLRSGSVAIISAIFVERLLLLPTNNENK
ncbi:MAG: hypothetical protein H0W88_01565 [Parachlamydiaceae bacterium]|nr:hypothetical protein [Parachlamydiaceae bacterium]